jgi:predicted O-linked N-acetylglucosamine transferase (SPINDLY family)
MGVPVVALAGNAYWSRQGAAIASQIGMRELVACSEPEYVRIAADLASNQARLSRLRGNVRSALRNISLCDWVTFTRTFQEGLRRMVLAHERQSL